MSGRRPCQCRRCVNQRINKRKCGTCTKQFVEIQTCKGEKGDKG